MGEEETCKECRTWEEEMYWTHFHCLHFSQTFLPDCNRLLPLPKKFTTRLRKKLPEMINLRGPSGMIWKVGLTTLAGMYFFSDGWEEFAIEHHLKENDLLVFKYNGESHFSVVIIDGESMCEKEAAYFVRKCGGHKAHGNSSKMKLNEQEPSVEVSTDSDNIDGESFSNKTDSGTDAQPSSESFKIPVTRTSQPKVRSLKRSHSKMGYAEAKELDNETGDDSDTNQASRNQKKVGQHEYFPNRRPVTEEEKANAKLLALAALSDKGFMRIMRPTCVYRAFNLTIPSYWIRRHLQSFLGNEIILRLEGKTWRSKFCWTNSRNYANLSSGWKQFALDNKLQEFDVCVFEPDGKEDDLMVLKVTIFRVVQEAKA